MIYMVDGFTKLMLARYIQIFVYLWFNHCCNILSENRLPVNRWDLYMPTKTYIRIIYSVNFEPLLDEFVGI